MLKMYKKELVGDECAYCAAKANGNNVILRKCSKCLLVFYCSEECQRYHWSAGEHKRFCLSPKDRNLLGANQSFEDETSAE